MLRTNVGLIIDFSVADDAIRLDDAVFGRLSGGTLVADQFVIGAAAQDGDDRIVYDDATGALFHHLVDAGGAAAGPVRNRERGTGTHQPRLLRRVMRITLREASPRKRGARQACSPGLWRVVFASKVLPNSATTPIQERKHSLTKSTMDSSSVGAERGHLCAHREEHPQHFV